MAPLNREALRLGLAVAAIAAIIDQAFKLTMLFGLGLVEHDRIVLTDNFEILMLWNHGVSYGLFQQETAAGQWFLAGFKVAAILLLGWWLSRADTRLTAVALGLVIGGAIGNAIDRVAYGAVADFFHFHVGDFSWYVFNLADVAIVAGVAVLLYDAVSGGGRRASGDNRRKDRGEA